VGPNSAQSPAGISESFELLTGARPGTGVSTDSNDSAKADSIDIMRALSEDRPEA